MGHAKLDFDTQGWGVGVFFEGVNQQKDDQFLVI